jgi:predicted NAD/FAD-binding protein
LRHGFHEDGLASAVHVAEFLGASVPWRTATPAAPFSEIRPLLQRTRTHSVPDVRGAVAAA